MAYGEPLAERIRRGLARRTNVEARKMFGGIGFLPNGYVCVGVWQDSLVARVGPEQYEEALQEASVGESDITGRAMKGWVLVAPEGIEDDEHLLDWIRRAAKFVRALPAKCWPFVARSGSWTSPGGPDSPRSRPRPNSVRRPRDWARTRADRP